MRHSARPGKAATQSDHGCGVLKERALPLTSSQRVTLLNLIKEKPVLQNRPKTPGIAEKISKG